ncbi:hypothetical protein [Paraferrimonas sp. SM1919]|uniref:hypothetical protein n=1 Tax=Paraferrimonas sp. SM1919 TaxID=2662263 RepID=UPI0013D4D8F2|nr:hypothetical protein [Paraferrimonas sp. SM1919]
MESIEWGVRFTYLDLEPNLAIYIFVGLFFSMPWILALIVIFEFKLRLGTPWRGILLITVLFIIGSLSKYFKNSKTYDYIDHMADGRNVIVGNWHVKNKVKMGTDYETVIVDEQRLDVLGRGGHWGCLSKPFSQLLPSPHHKEQLIKVSYIKLDKTLKTGHHSSEFEYCIIEVYSEKQY